MSYNDNFNFDFYAMGTPDESGITRQEGTDNWSKVPNLSSSLNGTFNPQTLTEDLKLSAETAKMQVGMFGKDTDLFSSLTTDNKLRPTFRTIDNLDVYKTLNNGDSVAMFKNVRNIATDENRLALQQTTGEQWAHGLTKAGQNFTKVFIQNTAGAIYGAYKAMADWDISKIYDNGFTDALDDWNTRSMYHLANYKTEEEKQSSFFKRMGTANFWADDFAQGLSFTLGTIASELAWTYLTGGSNLMVKGATKIGSLGSKVSELGTVGRVLGRGLEAQSELMSAAGQAKSINNYFSGLKAFSALKPLSKFKDGTQIARSIYTSAAMEAGMEAKQTLRDSYDSYLKSYITNNGKTPSVEEIKDFDDKARYAANLVFGANIPIVAASNFAQFGELFGVNFGIGKSIGKVTGFNKWLGLESKLALEALTKTTGAEAFKVGKGAVIGGIVLPKLGNMITEGVWEEGMQGVLSNSAKEWVASRYNVDKTEDNISMSTALYNAFKREYGTSEGWNEDILMGMLIGAFGGNVEQAISEKSPTKLITGLFTDEYKAQRETNISNWNTLRSEYNDIGKKTVSDNFGKVLNNTINRIILKNQQDYNTEKSQESLSKGDVVEANIYKMNAEFAKHYSTFERMKDSVDWTFEDVMNAQIDAMDENQIAKEHGISIEEAKQAKEDYKSVVKTQINNYRKADQIAESTIKLMGKKGEQVAPLKMFLSNQLYNAQGLDDMMTKISSLIGEMYGRTDFASVLRLTSNLKRLNGYDISRYEKNVQELNDAQEELENLNKSLPSIVDKKLDEEGNKTVVSRKEEVLNKIEQLTYKVGELSKQKEKTEKRLNEILKINDKTEFGGLFSDKDSYRYISGDEIIQGLNSIKELDIYKNELMSNKNTKSQGIYLHNLLETYGKGLMTMQNLSTIYNELADSNNKNTASFLLRLKGKDIQEFKETEEEKKRLDDFIDKYVKAGNLKDRVINDKDEIRSVVRAFLRAGDNFYSKRFDREDLVKVYDYEKDEFKNPDAYLTEIEENVNDEQWASYVKEGLNEELDTVKENIVSKISNKIPLSNREQIIYNDNNNLIDKEVKKYKKNPPSNIITVESIIQKQKELKRNSKMKSKNTFLKENKTLNPEKDYLEEKIARKLKNLNYLSKNNYVTDDVISLVKDFSEKDISDYLKLLKKKKLSIKDKEKLETLKDKLQKISELQGTVTEGNSTLLDDINQLAQLIDFSKTSLENNFKGVNIEDVADTDLEFSKELRNSGGRDLSIAQNYSNAFVTKKEQGDRSFVEISNISPVTFFSNIEGVITDLNDNIVSKRSLITSNAVDSVFKIVMVNGTKIPFSINKHGNIVFDINNGDFQKLKDNSNYLFDSISAFSKAQPLLFNSNGNILYVESDISNDDLIYNEKTKKDEVVRNFIDQDAIRNLKKDDELLVVFPSNNAYNKTLKRGKQTYEEGVLLLYTKDGKFVGVLKRTNTSEEATSKDKDMFYLLRKNAIDNASSSTAFVNEKQGLIDTGIRLTVDMIWHGHPTLSMKEVNGNIEINNFDFNDNSVKKVLDVGYVLNGDIITKSGNEDLKLSGQYYMTSTLKNNIGKKVPFVVIELNGRKVMYPVNLKIIDSNPINNFNNILTDVNLTNGEKVLQLNELLNRYGIPHTSLFFDNDRLLNQTYINKVQNRLTDSDLYANMDSWMDEKRNKSDILKNDININIDLTNQPFHSPKIKFNYDNLSQDLIDVKEEKSKKNNKPSLTESEFYKQKVVIENQIASLPNGGVSLLDGKIVYSREAQILKAKLDDLIDRFNVLKQNQENKKRGNKKIETEAKKEINKKCK